MKLLKRFSVMAVILCSIFFSSQAMAVEDSFVEVGNLKSDPLVKLCRGFANVIFGPFELLKHPYLIAEANGEVAGITYGVAKGILETLKREAVGFVEITTFMIPLPGANDDPREPGWGYGPLMRPAWVMGIGDNAFNLFYDDGAMTN